jgi:DNA polymerase-3 subunit alpha
VPAEEWDPKHRLAVEREMLGPTSRAIRWTGSSRRWRQGGHLDLGDLAGDVAEERITVDGILAGVNRRVNKNGEPGLRADRRPRRWHRGAVLPRCYQVVVDVAEDAIVLVKAR